MSQKLDEYNDPAVIKSNFDRRDKDSYYTEPWITRALIAALRAEKINISTVWEPACGRGDMVRVLREHYIVTATDIDLSNYEYEDGYEQDFLKLSCLIPGNSSIITNPPYNLAEEFVNHALGFDVKLIAMLMRNEWDCAKSRTYLFNQAFLNKRFAMKVVLTSRPRWDDWKNKARPDKSPRHSFGWYVWVDNWTGPAIIRYQGK